MKLPSRFDALLLVANSTNTSRYQIIQDNPVNVDFTFKVTKRARNSFLGEIAQNGGAFRTEVEGKLDGVNLKMKMIRRFHGAPHNFEFGGQVVGSLGQLSMRGFKIDGVYTEGQIVLQ